jgi:hypothetical protein
MDRSSLTNPLVWVQETFGTAELGDPRRSKRLVRVAASMAADPQGSLPREMGGNWADLRAAYRLVRADGVTHEAISRPVWQQTRQQGEQEPGVMLLVHDDTEVDYGYGPAISGLGPIGNGNHRGFFVHTVLAVVPRGTSERVLGLLQQEAWVRQPAPREADGSKQSTRQRRERPRESEVWRRAVALVGSPPEGQVWIHVADRYADMCTFVQRCREMGTFFLVRAAENRRVLVEEEQAEPELDHLLDRAKSWPAQAQGSIAVPSEHERRARQAQVQLSWGSMQLLPADLPTGTQGTTSPLPLWVVRVWEPEPPSKKEAQRDWVPQQKHRSKKRTDPQSEEVEALEWILLSALPVESAEQAWQAVDRYASRWPIEDFHRGVKTGCRLEQRHLQEQRSLENLLAIVSPIAVRLLQLRNLCREEPEQPATKWVEPEEAQVIASQQGEALEQLTIEQFVSSVAQLGGFLRRASDGPPGWQTLWDGWLRLRWFVAGIRFATTAPVDASARSPCING